MFDTAAAPDDLRTCAERAIFMAMTPVDSFHSIRAATLRAAENAKAEALLAGWTPERANALGRFIVEVGTDIAVDAVKAGIATPGQILNR